MGKSPALVHQILRDWREESKSPPFSYSFNWAKGQIDIYTARPGLLIGKGGSLAEKYIGKMKAAYPSFNIRLHEFELHYVK